jgi:hypothetical protein
MANAHNNNNNCTPANTSFEEEKRDECMMRYCLGDKDVIIDLKKEETEMNNVYGGVECLCNVFTVVHSPPVPVPYYVTLSAPYRFY